MDKTQRLNYIIDTLDKERQIHITEISQRIGVSDDTLRRDLAILGNQGLLTRVHGGAVLRSDTSPQILDRYDEDALAKRGMAKKIVQLFSKGDSILIDGGTSNLEVAKILPQDMNLTIFTNSFPIANVLFCRSDVKVIFLGGEIDCEGQVTLGVATYKELQRIYTDWAIIGVSDIHPLKGLFCIKREEALIKREILERAEKRVVMASSEKLDKARVYNISSLGDIDFIVTDDCCIDKIRETWPLGKCKVL